MSYRLVERTREYVENLWHASQDEALQSVFPFNDFTLEESFRLFEASLKPYATSFGRSILIDGKHVGDVWCYSIDESNERSCFFSIVIFDSASRGEGIGYNAASEFVRLLERKYDIDKVCAFTYKDNEQSIALLKKVGFEMFEEFVEDGRASLYFELKFVR